MLGVVGLVLGTLGMWSRRRHNCHCRSVIYIDRTAGIMRVMTLMNQQMIQGHPNRLVQHVYKCHLRISIGTSFLRYTSTV